MSKATTPIDLNWTALENYYILASLYLAGLISDLVHRYIFPLVIRSHIEQRAVMSAASVCIGQVCMTAEMDCRSFWLFNKHIVFLTDNSTRQRFLTQWPMKFTVLERHLARTLFISYPFSYCNSKYVQIWSPLASKRKPNHKLVSSKQQFRKQ